MDTYLPIVVHRKRDLQCEGKENQTKTKKQFPLAKQELKGIILEF